MEAAALLAEVYAGETFYIPMARRAKAVALLSAGETVPAVAAELNVARATVRRYRREAARQKA